MDKLANITRQDLYDLTHTELGIPKSECSNFVDDLFATIIQNLKKKIKVKLSLFGAFNIRKKNSRIGRNPKTKETKIINSRYVVTFKSSKLLLKKINKVS
jgi:integration host factor subunit alpha